MVEEILYIIDKYFNLGILGMAFSALFILMAVGILVYNAVWSNELRIAKGYKLANQQFAKINHIDAFNKKLFDKHVIKILPLKARKAWREMMVYNSTTSRGKLKKAIESEYDMGTFIGIMVMLVTYIVGGVLMVISGAINVDFNTFHGFSMGIAMVIGAFCVLAVVIQMSYISAKHAEAPVNLYNALCDRVAKTATILVPVDDVNVNCEGKIVVMNEKSGENCVKELKNACYAGDARSLCGQLECAKENFGDFNETVIGNIDTNSKADELVAVIKEFAAGNPSKESLEHVKICLEETLGYGYCDNAERKKLLLAKLLLD